jgi:hypothetical protein
MHNRPPWPVLLAVALSIISISYSFLSVIHAWNWKNPAGVLIYILLLSVAYLYISSIYKGRNWARIILFIATLLSVVTAPKAFQNLNYFTDKFGYLFQFILGIISTTLVYLPASHRWFNRKRNSVEQGAAANP